MRNLPLGIFHVERHRAALSFPLLLCVFASAMVLRQKLVNHRQFCRSAALRQKSDQRPTIIYLTNTFVLSKVSKRRFYRYIQNE